MINSILYIMAFIMGTFIGSFCTLAVYRIPLKQDILYKRSYCPNCNHRLGAFDLIPVLSYILLKGKCRYCKQKVRIRYLILEIFFGLTYMFFIMSFNIDIFCITVENLLLILFFTLYLITMFLTAGISKEYGYIHNSLLIFQIVLSFAYIVYLYIVQANIYRYVIYLLLIIMLYIMKKKYNNSNKMLFILQGLILIAIMAIFTNIYMLILTLILTFITLFVSYMLNKKIKDKSYNYILFYLCVYNIIFILMQNYLGCE